MNLAKILEKYVWRSSFSVKLQACRLIAANFTNRWTPSFFKGFYLDFKNTILSPPSPLSHAPTMYWLKPCYQILKSLPNGEQPPPMFSTPVGNPGHWPSKKKKKKTSWRNTFSLCFIFHITKIDINLSIKFYVKK